MDELVLIVVRYDAHRYLGPVPHDTSYYAKCMLGGALACGFTHAGITPLDVTKCNMQVCIFDPDSFSDYCGPRRACAGDSWWFYDAVHYP